MNASASKNNRCLQTVRFYQSGGPVLSHLSGASGTAKRCANWTFVSGVPPVSPNLKLIERIQRKKVGNGRKSINWPKGPFAGTGGTGAKVTRVCGETAGPRHGWDRWDPSKRDLDASTRRLNLVTGLRGSPRSPDTRQGSGGAGPDLRSNLKCVTEWKSSTMNSSSS
jgi:hypothetical protein